MISVRKIALLSVSVLVMVALLGAPDWARAAGDTVKVFILAGQSNMEGKAGNTLLDHQATDPKTKDFFAHLRDGEKWVVRDDVFIKFLGRKGPLTIGYGSPGRTGSELEFGHMMGEHFDEPVILIKAAWGGHSLFQLFRSPSAGLPSDEKLQAALEQAQNRVKQDNEKNNRNNPLPTMEDIKKPYGSSYRNMMAEVKDIFDNYETLFPELKGEKLEVAGFVWFQGFNDQWGDAPGEYESNMKHFIKDVRKDLNAPNLPFVIAAIGTSGSKPAQGGQLEVRNAQMAMNDVPEFKGNVKAFRTDLLVDKEAERLIDGWQNHYEEWAKVGSDRPYHYLGSAIWYTRIGHAMGEAMIELMPKKDQCAAGKVFLMTPADPAKTYPRFHIGVTGIYATIEKGLLVTVDSTEPGTPAEGKFQKGDILVKVNGRPISDPEPYIALGNALTAAEAGDGKLVFTIKRGDKEESVALTIPVLGAYSRTWPLNCKKSDAIVRQAAKFLAQPENLKNPGFFGGLVLLSTGDDQYLPAVKAMVDRNSPDKASTHTWNNGYAGILIAEYYLRTGDKSALPRLKALCVDAKERQYFGGWCHWDGPVPGYVQGGLMNPAGVQVLSTLILAKECSVEVDQGTFDGALTFFYRFAGHEAVPYGDHRTEGWLGGNGKNGMLAGALSLLDGKAYRMAAHTMSLDMADSYRWLGAGHGSSFGDHIWRGLGSVHVPKDKQGHYRLSMDKLAWYYDLCRRPKGGFSLLNLGANVGENVVWGHGLALAYTAPRKTLRITGAPHTQYSQKVQVPDLPWGRPRDLEFLRTDYCEGFGKEEMEPHEIYDKLGDAYNKPKEKADKAFCVKMMRHYNPTARRQAGAALARLGATDEILAALQHQDPRVRRAALEALTQYRCWWGGGTASFPPAVMSQKYLPSILKILNDPGSSYWEIDGALLALGMAELSDVTANLDQVRKYLRHEEWWLREAAWRAIGPLSKDEKRIEPVLPALFDCLAKETHVMPRRAYMGCLHGILKDAKMSGGIKQKVVAGMLRAVRDTVIEPGYLGGVGRNNKYETLRYFLAQAPEAAPQVLDELEQHMLQPDFFAGWGWAEAWFIGDGWGNPGIIKCAEKLGKAKGAPLLARCKRVVARLEEQKKQSQGKDVKAIEDARDKMIAAVTKAIQECEKKMKWAGNDPDLPGRTIGSDDRR